MKKFMIKKTILGVASAMALMAGSAFAQEPKDAGSLDQLLNQVQQSAAQENKLWKQREAQFKKAKDRQQQMLKDAKAELTALEEESARLEKVFELNDQKILDALKRLKERQGSYEELKGHITTTAGDASSTFKTSITSAQFPNREEFLDALVAKLASDELPEIAEIQRLWIEIQREMTQSGKVAKFSTTVADAEGQKSQQEVVRIGTFNVVTAEGSYLNYSDGTLTELPRQPDSSYTNRAEELAAAAGSDFVKVGVDPTGPSGGSFLAAIINSPTLVERWHQGGVVGYIISAIGVIAMIIAIWRLLVLTAVAGKVKSQVKSPQDPRANNPLGRVLMVNAENKDVDPETLELKLAEAVLKEIPSLENSLALLKIIAAVAPLLGLLGTVTGMIITFQAITIYGAGDPKAMAGGISGALVTTVLGLVVAIPTVLMHTIVNGRSKKVIHILEEQTTGLIASHNESNA